MNTDLKDFTPNKLIHVKRSDWTAFDLERLGTIPLCAWIPLPAIVKGEWGDLTRDFFANLTKCSKRRRLGIHLRNHGKCPPRRKCRSSLG